MNRKFCLFIIIFFIKFLDKIWKKKFKLEYLDILINNITTTKFLVTFDINKTNKFVSISLVKKIL